MRGSEVSPESHNRNLADASSLINRKGASQGRAGSPPEVPVGAVCSCRRRSSGVLVAHLDGSCFAQVRAEDQQR